MKLRGAIIQNKQLRLLPMENIVSKESGVWNLSSEQGNLGNFYITNVRVVWFADMNENFNLSLPYLQFSVVKIRESKFGTALVIETVENSGGYVLGFRIDPPDRLRQLHKEISSLHSVYSKSPIFGVEYSIKNEPLLSEELAPETPVDADVDYTDDVVPGTYLAYSMMEGPRGRPVFIDELGLAFEELPEDSTITSLWNALPSIDK